MNKISISEFYSSFFAIVKMLIAAATLKTENEKKEKENEIDAAIKTLRGRFDASGTNGALKSSINYTLLTLKELQTNAEIVAAYDVLKNFESNGRESKKVLISEIEELKKQLAELQKNDELEELRKQLAALKEKSGEKNGAKNKSEKNK